MAKKILSKGNTNAKLEKSVKTFKNYDFWIMYIAPTINNGVVDLCPSATEGCRKGCLFTAGRGCFNNVKTARLNKADWLVNDTEGFLRQLIKEIKNNCKNSIKKGKTPVFRLNGSSDISFERGFDFLPKVNDTGYQKLNLLCPDTGKTVIDIIADCGGLAYDYTKRLERLDMAVLKDTYHLTFSASEVNQVEVNIALDCGFNVAVVFKNQLPKTYLGKTVINADTTDFRFIEGYQSLICGLVAKGKAKKDTTGFVIDTDIIEGCIKAA